LEALIPHSPSHSPEPSQIEQEAEEESRPHEVRRRLQLSRNTDSRKGQNAGLAFRPKLQTQAQHVIESQQDDVVDARAQDGLLHDLAFRTKKVTQQDSDIRPELEGDGGGEMTLAELGHLQHGELPMRGRDGAQPGTLIKRDREDGDEDGSGDVGEKDLVALPDRSKKPRRKRGSH
jgi:hypothetical protein